MEVLGTCHGQIAAGLLGLWGLPAPMIEAIALHHFPGCRGNFEFSALTAVHVANALEHEAMPGNAFTGAAAMDEGYIRAGGFENRLQEWRRDCLAQSTRLGTVAA
jgi:HD-like signal output (HDOD) protein